MRCYTKQHKTSCGIDLHARSMYVCRLRQDGESLLHRHMQTSLERFLKALAPARAALGVAVACRVPWYGRAALWAREARPFLLGPALSMQAMHGGKATHDTLDAQHIAVWLRGGLLPQADVSPAERRAPRALLRRRRPLTRQRAAWLAHRQNTHRQDTLPESGTKLASTAHRTGGAERLPAPAVPHRMAGALALRGDDAPRRSEGE